MSGVIPRERLERNLARVRQHMAESAAKASRPLSEIKLLAVTKYVDQPTIASLLELGLRDFGESRVQDAERKIKSLDGATRWHLIGHLQTNKADKAAKLFQMIHSVDSVRVAEALNKEAAHRAPAPALECLLELNIAGEANKYGLRPNLSELEELLKKCADLPNLRIGGMMSMAPYAENPEATSRPVFKKLRELLEVLNAKRCYPHDMRELSMGMTQDYCIAIEEGATWVRVGSALFE